MRRGSINFAEPERHGPREAPRGPRRGVLLFLGFGAVAGLAFLVFPAAGMSQRAPAEVVSDAGPGPSPARKHAVHTRMAMAALGRKRPSVHSPDPDPAAWVTPSAPDAVASENP